MDDGLLGDLVYAEGDYWNPKPRSSPKTWRETPLGGGAFIEGGCHAVDALRYLGGEIVEVSAFSGGPKRDMSFEFDPVAVASVRFESGAVGKLSAIVEADTPYVFNVRLLGTEGTIQNNRVFSSERYPGGERLLGVSDDPAGSRRCFASPLRRRDRALSELHRKRRRVARIHP